MIVFDLDGTLADCEHRRHFVTIPKETKHIFTDVTPHENGCILIGEYRFQDGKKFKPDYKSFYEACDKDNLIIPVAEIYDRLWKQNDYYDDFQIWSGRCESVRKKTSKWLDKHNITYSLLKMRP